ncbi:hypothetical protein Tco_0154527 [Tanacetum coccineum]
MFSIRSKTLVILTTYNLLMWLCMKETSFMLMLLITGRKALGKDIYVYLRSLIDDLIELWKPASVKTIDVVASKEFKMRVMLLWTINDFTTRSSLSGWSGQGYMACPTCNKDTPSKRVLSKTAFVGHRRFLKKKHKWRRSPEFNGQTDDGDPPRKFTQEDILTQLDRLPTHEKGKHPSYEGANVKCNHFVKLNWTKRSIFNELEYWSFLTLKHSLIVMHIRKNMLESFLGTLLMNEKSKDTTKASKDLKTLGIRKELLLDRFRSNFKQKVTDNDSNITSMKSYDYHIMMQWLLPYRLYAFFDIMIHLVIPLPEEALEGGPIPYMWMYPFERYMKKLINYVRNKPKTEGSIAEGYVAEEAMTFCSHYFQGGTTKFNHPDRNMDCPPLTCQFQLFRSICRTIGKRSIIQLDY